MVCWNHTDIKYIDSMVFLNIRADKSAPGFKILAAMGWNPESATLTAKSYESEEKKTKHVLPIIKGDTRGIGASKSFTAASITARPSMGGTMGFVSAEEAAQLGSSDTEKPSSGNDATGFAKLLQRLNQTPQSSSSSSSSTPGPDHSTSASEASSQTDSKKEKKERKQKDADKPGKSERKLKRKHEEESETLNDQKNTVPSTSSDDSKKKKKSKTPKDKPQKEEKTDDLDSKTTTSNTPSRRHHNV